MLTSFGSVDGLDDLLMLGEVLLELEHDEGELRSRDAAVDRA